MRPELKESNNAIDLKSILDQRSIRTRFQSIVSLRDHGPIGVEALSYGLDPVTGGRISPAALFSRATQISGTLLLDRLCRQRALAAFRGLFAANSDLLLWLNIETSILNTKVVGTGHLMETVLKSGLYPHNVVIEIVESQVADLDALIRFVDQHKKLGFFIALDDVGAGHSNLERIALLKPDIIKIDRFLIQDLDREYHKQEVVRSLYNLAGGIGAVVVAEGIETEAEALTVLDLGVNLQQGYYYAHPDQNYAQQLAQCQSKIRSVAERYRLRRMVRFSRRKEFFSSIGENISNITRRLSQASFDQFEGIMKDTLCQDNTLECLYVLDGGGMQISETLCDAAKLYRPSSPLFRPTPRGTDLSLKDYYLLIKAGLTRYISDPYISRASGNLCVTVSQLFTTSLDREYILCADYGCDELEMVDSSLAPI